MKEKEIKKEYYSDTQVVKDYDRRRFVRGSGRYVIQKEEKCIKDLISLTSLSSGGIAIDCPTGTGRFIPLLQETGFEVLAADTSEPMLKLAKSFSAKKYFQCDAETFPVQDSSVDLWLMSRFCFHFKDPSAFVMEASRVLKLGGYLIADFYHWTPRSWIPGFLFGGRTYNHNTKLVNQWASQFGFEVVQKMPAFFMPPYLYGFMPIWLTHGIENLSDRIAPSFKTKSYYLLRKIENLSSLST